MNQRLIEALNKLDENIVIEGDDILIQGDPFDADDITIERAIQGIERGEIVDIEGFFSFIKKAARKVSSVGKIANKFGLLPPGTNFGLSMLNKLAKSPKTKNRVKFTPAATGNVYRFAYLKGYSAALLKIIQIANKLRRSK